MTTVKNSSRRRFLKHSAVAGGALVVGAHIPELLGPKLAVAQGAAKPFAPNAFVRVAADNTVTVVVKHFEMGQGTFTGLPQLVAEELNVDWKQVRVEAAPADAKLYNNLAWGPVQGTGGSSSLANSWEQLRTAGAQARMMLVQAAANQWKVDPAKLVAEKGWVMENGSKRKASYGQLAAAAAKLEPPKTVKLKEPKEWTLIGKPLPRTDSAAKSTGTATFGMDIKLPGLLTAMIERPPVVGGKVKSVDDKAAKAVKGVRAVLQVPQGVAVIATGYWAAKKGREALKIDWDHGANTGISSAALVAQYKEMAKTPGAVAKKNGDAAAAFGAAAKKAEATYEFPFLAHAPMEPLNCTVQIGKDGVEIWTASQFQTIDQLTAARVAGFKPEQVKINTLFAGGSFGRRANLQADYIAEAVAVAKAAQGAGIAAPIKTVRTREDDTQAHYFRPIYVHTMQGGVDAEGKPVAWAHRIVGQSILTGTPFEPAYVKNGVDFTSVEGAATLPYDIPNLLVDLHSPKSPVPILWWRVVGASHTVFAVETFIDRLAKEAGKDPVEFRLALMAKHPRHIGVLKLAAEKGDWGKPLPAGRGRGVAVTEAFSTFVAQVAEVTVKANGSYKVDRVVCAVDCGVAVNPDVVKAQMEGGIGFGLGAALFGEITMKDGRVEQSNFHDYRVLRFDEMPKVETHIVASTAKPTGVGEPGVAPVAAAVANAIAAATGKWLTKMPFGEKV